MQWPWRKTETDLDREMRFHLETLADTYERQGLSRKEALRRARAEFGGLEQIKEQCRDESRWRWLVQSTQDLRFGWRMMRKTPSITVAAAVSLALGIGATATLLGFAEAVLWRTLPVPQAHQMVEVLWRTRKSPELFRGSSGSGFREDGWDTRDFFSKRAYETMRARLNGKAEVAGHIGSSLVSASYSGNVFVARMRGVTGNFFPVLRLQPRFGRLLTERDEPATAPHAVVVTEQFWRKQLGATESALDRTLQINNAAYVIAGVLPASFHGLSTGDDTEIYSTIFHSSDYLGSDPFLRREAENPEAWWMQLIARRSPNLTADQLRSQLDAAFATSWVRQPKSPEATPQIHLLDASKGLGEVRRQFGSPINILLSFVAMVLLAACANIANLLLARGAHREKEIALRVSLGCGRARLAAQFFTESVLLAILGGLLSLPVSSLLATMMLTVLPPGLEGVAISAQPSPSVLAGTAAVTLLTAVLFGIYPAWRATRVDAGPALKEGNGSAGTSSRARWTPARLLVTAQVTLGTLLVTGAIIFTSHLNTLVSRDTGFERSKVILFDVRPGELGYTGERLRLFYRRLEERIATVPTVQAVGLAQTRPMRGGGWWDDLHLPGSTKRLSTAVQHASAGFLDALGVPLVAGRFLTAQEVRDNAKVTVISEDAVQQLGLASPLGAIVHTGDFDYTVVGVAAKARYSRMTQSPLVTYLPVPADRRTITVVVRTTGSPRAVINSLRSAVQDLDRNLPILDLYSMEQQISRTLLRERLFAWMCGSFGLLSLVLCVVGLYGLMSHTTARRTPEIGIRIALGASRGDVIRQVLWDGFRLAAIGLTVGIPTAIYAARFVQNQKLLPDFTLPYWTLFAAFAVLFLSALAAVLGPALRAAAVDPMKALRQG